MTGAPGRLPADQIASQVARGWQSAIPSFLGNLAIWLIERLKQAKNPHCQHWQSAWQPDPQIAACFLRLGGQIASAPSAPRARRPA